MSSSLSSDSDSSSSESAKFKRHQFWQKSRLWLTLYLLCLPTIGSLLLFSYYPKVDVVIMSFFRWVPSQIREFIGFDNFREAFADPQFWQSFKLVGILLVANLAKLWPGILAAIALHRLANAKMRYFFQICFVVPMIIPAMVWLLIWKSFYDPDFGILNRVLNLTGGMSILNGLDSFMPKVASVLEPVFSGFINPVFGGVGGVILLGFTIFACANRKEHDGSRWIDYGLILGSSLIVPIFAWTGLYKTMPGAVTMVVLIIVALVLLCKQLGNSWVAWPFLILGGIAIFWGKMVYLPITLVTAFCVYEIIRGKRDFYTSKPIMMTISLTIITLGSLLIVFGNIWTEPLEQFSNGNPAWLGNKDLVIPALIFWGFPWVGTVGVLIYLSGLQNIPLDVYEAAELDGVSPIGMIWFIELPLIMTQVRINLIFLTINTLVAYETFLILLGPDGGPGNKGMVPGLYMFSSAFSEGRFGYACALGMVLFVIILLLTIIYQKYVRVDK